MACGFNNEAGFTDIRRVVNVANYHIGPRTGANLRYLKYLYMSIGVALFGVIIAETDFGDAVAHLAQFGWGLAIVLALYLTSFSMDALTWLVTLHTAPLNLRWFSRLWRIRLVGEAFNMTVPAGGMGGEPVKAILLKKRYGVGYREGAASLLMSKTVNILALLLFLSAGFFLMLRHTAIPETYVVAGGFGLTALTFGIVSFFAIQRFQLSSILTGKLEQWPVFRSIVGKLDDIREVENHFLEFYSRDKLRFTGAMALALLSWAIGVLEIYYALEFLGHPVSLAEAWIIESMTQRSRAGSFFIPASIGAQDGAFVLMCTAITGSPELGVAVALVRRMREIIWIASGFALASLL
ncbi:MAG: lysylphosphatidylglycerol synthase domain-containing protein, partial [Alphaproteobacteria bacterium]